MLSMRRPKDIVEGYGAGGDRVSLQYEIGALRVVPTPCICLHYAWFYVF